MDNTSMDKEHTSIDDLFGRARSEEPRAGFEQTEQRFFRSVGAATGSNGVDSSTFTGSSSFKTIIIMTITIIAATIATLTFFNSNESFVEIPDDPAIPQVMEERQSAPLSEESDGYSERDEMNDKARPFEQTAASATTAYSPDVLEERNDGEVAQGVPRKQTQASYYRPGRSVGAYASKKDSSANEVLFLITEGTTQAELDRIQVEAEKVGVDFEYTMKGNGSRMKKMSIRLEDDLEGKRTAWMLSTGNFFNIRVGWSLDEDGRAREIIDELGSVNGAYKTSGWAEAAETDSSMWTVAEGPSEGGLFGDKTVTKYSNRGSGVVSLYIDGSTSDLEIDAIRAKAEKAGIQFDFSKKLRRATTVQLTLILKESKQTMQTKVDKGEDWRIDFAWREDLMGRAIEFMEVREDHLSN